MTKLALVWSAERAGREIDAIWEKRQAVERKRADYDDTLRAKLIEAKANYDGSFKEFVGAVVVEPVLARFEALQHGVPGGLVVGGRVLAGRVVAATDVPAGRAAAQVQPPARRRAR